MPQLPPQLLVGLRAQLVTQDQVTHDYSTTTDYTFDCKELKEIAAFSRAIHNNSLDTTTQLLECYLIVLHLYNFHVLSHTRLSVLPPFQDCIQYTKMVQVSQDFVYYKNMASNQSKYTYILYFILTRHFILLFYSEAKCYTEQIKNRTVIFYQQAYKQLWIVSLVALLATNLVFTLKTGYSNPFSLTYEAILSDPALSAQSETNSDQSAATSASSAAEQVPPDPEHLQSTTGPTQDTSMAADDVLTQDY